MDSILRAVAIYAILMIIFRISGKRSLAQITTFDFVLLLVIGEATQQALLGDDFSLTNAALVIITLLGLDIALSMLQERFSFLTPWIERWAAGARRRGRNAEVPYGEDTHLRS